MNKLLVFRKRLSRTAYWIVTLTSLCLFLTTWWVVSATKLVSPVFFPAPSTVFATALRMFGSQGFISDILASCARIAVAFSASAVLAIPLGILMSSVKAVQAFIEPLIEFVRYIPVPALTSLVVLWGGGIGETSKFVILFLGTFFQLVLLVMDDADNAPTIYFDVARTMGASNWQLVRDVLVPYLFPQIYDRMRVTLGWCWTYLVIAELIAVQHGVGHTIKEAQRFNAADQLFVCFFTLGVIGISTDFCMKFFYDRLFPYATKSTSRQ